MESLYRNERSFFNTETVIDYIPPMPVEDGFDSLPVVNVIFILTK